MKHPVNHPARVFWVVQTLGTSGLDQESELLEECERLTSKFRVTEAPGKSRFRDRCRAPRGVGGQAWEARPGVFGYVWIIVDHVLDENMWCFSL